MSTLQKYVKLKKQVEEAQQKAIKAGGALEQVMQTLEDEFGCKTLGEAKRYLKKLIKDEAKAKEAFETSIGEFEEKWSDKQGMGR